MKEFNVAVLLLALVLIPVAGCAGETEADPADQAAQAETATAAVAEAAMAEDDAVDVDAVQDPAAGATVMDRPLDGSSVESFTRGLELVEQEAGAADMQSLNMALQWLLFYDIGANNDKATLYQRLDGQTPAQIIERVKRK